MILGLQNGGANYAARVTLPEGGEELYSIIGCWQEDQEGLLKDYEKNRKDYPGLDRFVPRIVDFFNGYGDEVDRDLAGLKERENEKWERPKSEGPKIVSIIPENGAVDVDPNLTEIRIVFDRRMRTDTFAVMFRPGEEDQFPELAGREHYDAEETTFIIPVKLKPGWTYKFGLNSRQAAGFMDQKGVPLYPVKITFTTRKE